MNDVIKTYIKNRTKISRIDLAGYAKKQLFCSVRKFKFYINQ